MVSESSIGKVESRRDPLMWNQRSKKRPYADEEDCADGGRCIGNGLLKVDML